MPESDFDNIIYVDVLNETSSRYDRTRAGSSEQTLVVMWSIYSVFFYIIR